MPNPIRLPNDRLLGAPKGWEESKHGPCGFLPVVVNQGCSQSVWSFTEAERARIAAGCNVLLSIVGGQPPVNLVLADITGEIVPLNPEDIDA